MSTLNNKQINPVSRVDFSRIRSASKVTKFQQPASKINWDWDGLISKIGEEDLGTATSTSLAYNKSWQPTSEFQTVKDLEGSQAYTDFSNYVKENASTDENVMRYLKALDAAARKTGAGSNLFDEAGNLKSDWTTYYDAARNDGKYGNYHLSASILPDPVDATPEEVEEEVEGPAQEVVGDYRAATYMKPYKPARMGGEHLWDIYHNNVESLNRQEKLLLQKKTPELSPETYFAKTSSGYLEGQQQKQNLAEQRNAFYKAAENSGDLSKSLEQMQNFELSVMSPGNQQISEFRKGIQDRSEQKVENAQNLTMQSHNSAGNTNIANRAAGWNERLGTKAKYDAARAAEYAGYRQNLNTQKATWIQNENQNRNLYNQQLNALRAAEEKDRNYQEYLNQLQEGYKNITGTNLAGQTINFDQVYASLLEDPDISDEDLQAAQQAANDPETLIRIMRKYAPQNADLSSYLTNYDAAFKDLDQELANKNTETQRKLDYLGLNSRLSYSNAQFGGQGLETNWDTIDWKSLGFLKKGGTVHQYDTRKDRFFQYAEHRRKLEKDVHDRTEEAHKSAQKKLIRDLDALDRETLLLLRAIFK